MWQKSYSTIVNDLQATQLWKIWSDINQWHTWQDDIEYAKLDVAFAEGSYFGFKPKGGPKFNLQLTKVVPNSVFVDLTRFPLAKMHDSHELIDRGNGVEIKTTIRIEGPLSFVWRKLVGENIVAGLKEQTEKLITKARNDKSHAL
jgi:hypothetical protein